MQSFKKNTIKIILLVMFLMTTVGAPGVLSAQSLTAEKTQLQNEVDAINNQLLALKQQKNTLANQLAIFDAQAAVIQAQINASQAQINTLSGQITTLNTQITESEAKLAEQKKLLNEYIKTMYINGQTSQLELMLTSNNFSDFVDKSQYLDSMQQKVSGAITSIKELKASLDTKKKALDVDKGKAEALKAAQVADMQAINVQANEKQSLISQTKGQEANYGAVLSTKAARIQQIDDALNAASGQGAMGGTFYGVPYYSQTDPSWASYNINHIAGSPMRTYGCAITSLSMLFASYGYYKSPGQIAYDSHFFSGDYMAWYNIPAATDYRFSNVSVGLDMAKADQWASSGKPFLVAINDAFGVNLDHYVIIIGKRGGSWVMNDPIRGGNLNFNDYYGPSHGKSVNQTDFITP
jgi:peptidoglycan hydrolase CwlO-like protein